MRSENSLVPFSAAQHIPLVETGDVDFCDENAEIADENLLMRDVRGRVEQAN